MTTHPLDPANGEPGMSSTTDKVFNRLFTESMALISDVSNYVDGPGRDLFASLPRPARLVYVDHGIVLSKRLIRGTVWLVTQKAVRDGEMSHKESTQQKYRVTRDDPAIQTDSHDQSVDLPAAFVGLLQRSENLFDQICRLNEAMTSTSGPGETSPIHNHMEQLQKATETGLFTTPPPRKPRSGK